MDCPWRFEQYHPSSACEISTPEPLSPERFTSESGEVDNFTKLLARLPYDPETWLNRGNCLRLLGYPELALGDIHKARLLVEAALDDSPSAFGEQVRTAFCTKTYEQHTTDPAWMRWAAAVSTPELLAQRASDMLKRLELQIWTELMEGLMAANCCVDYQRLSREAVAKFPEDEVFPSEVTNADAWYGQRESILQGRVDGGEMSEEQMLSTLLNGGVYPTAYPFMTDDFLVRDEAVFSGIQEDFRKLSTNSIVTRSTIRNTSQGEEQKAVTDDDDCIGVTATRAVPAGETVIIDAISATSVGVDGNPNGCPTCCASHVGNFRNQCCSVLYCSQKCADVALETFHEPVCGKAFAYLDAAAQKAESTTDFSLDALLLKRVLALTLMEPATHPLKSKLLVRLTPAYGFQQPSLIIFNFIDHIQTPIAILQTLGINIFTNPHYDTWVLHTIKCRLQNNKHGQTLDIWPGTSVNGLYSMFNHSCAPNVDWRHDTGSSDVTLFATKECEKEEELCISYIGQEGNDLSVGERRRKLMGWFGMNCRCKKCVEEAAAQEAVEGMKDLKVED